MIYIVEYTNEYCVGNHCMTMEVEADSLDAAYELIDEYHPMLELNTIYPKENEYDASW